MTLAIGDTLIKLDRETGRGVKPDEEGYESYLVIEFGPPMPTEDYPESEGRLVYAIIMNSLS